jgi:hypothetical protein
MIMGQILYQTDTSPKKKKQNTQIWREQKIQSIQTQNHQLLRKRALGNQKPFDIGTSQWLPYLRNGCYLFWCSLSPLVFVAVYTSFPCLIYSCPVDDFVSGLIVSVLLGFTASDYPFGIFKLFLWHKYCNGFFRND